MSRSRFDFTALIQFLTMLFNAFKTLFESFTKSDDEEEAAAEDET